MKANLLFFLVVIFSFSKLNAQNLITNNSFEKIDSSFVISTFTYLNQTFSCIEDWRTNWPIFNTPDLFFEGNNFLFNGINPLLLNLAVILYNDPLGLNYASTPNNYAGEQLARTGNKYIGLRTETPIVLNNDNTFSNNPYYEFIQIELSDSLIAGKSYRIVFYASIAENSVFQNNTLGAVVSNNSDLNLGVIPIDATINSENALIDSESWAEISGNFIAQGD